MLTSPQSNGPNRWRAWSLRLIFSAILPSQTVITHFSCHGVGIGGANLIKPELGYSPGSCHSQDVLLSRSTLSLCSMAISTLLAQGHCSSAWMLLA